MLALLPARLIAPRSSASDESPGRTPKRWRSGPAEGVATTLPQLLGSERYDGVTGISCLPGRDAAAEKALLSLLTPDWSSASRSDVAGRL